MTTETMIDPATFQNAFVLTGPTGSGKSAAGVRMALEMNAEIVSMDSMALYRGMDIGTAKPAIEERRVVPHHLLDVLDPWESATVAWWLEQAARCCREIEARGKATLFVGGTPLYLKAMLQGLFDGPPADLVLREQLEQEAAARGVQHLHNRLAAVDAATAGRLHPNDLRRVVRALEVWELTGRPMSEWQQQWKQRPAAGPRCAWIYLPRSELYERINARVEQMFAAGLVAEVEKLLQAAQPLSKEARQALGYKEVIRYLQGNADLADTIDEVKTRTRNFAKRQLTWFRRLPGCIPVAGELTSAIWNSRMKGGPHYCAS